MLGATRARAGFRALNGLALSGKTPFTAPRNASQFSSKLATLSKSRPQALAKPLTLALTRYAATKGPMDSVDAKHETALGKQKLEAHPDVVSVESSTHPIFHEVGMAEEEKDTDMMAGIRGDLKTIKETFSLEDVPREAYYVGMAGVLPYLGTSLATVFCAYEINHAAVHGAGIVLSEHAATLGLHVIEPLQVGYGAVIISFLGAIHWGLEFAGYGGYQGYPRYAIGVVAPAIAWPTILLPAEYALITQFLAFNFLYYADSRATKRGWAPEWYSVYRFVLTFIVGGSIVLSLIGRGQIADRVHLPSPADKIREIRAGSLREIEKEEMARRQKMASADEEDDEDEEEDEE